MAKLELTPWDGSEFIAEPDAQADLLADALESWEARYVAHALGLIAKARGMTRIARARPGSAAKASTNRSALTAIPSLQR